MLPTTTATWLANALYASWWFRVSVASRRVALRSCWGRLHLILRMSSRHILTLKLLAQRKRITLAEYERTAVDDHLRDLAATRSSPGSHAKELCRLTKWFIVSYRLSVGILMSRLQRGDLGRICWKAWQMLPRRTRTSHAYQNSRSKNDPRIHRQLPDPHTRHTK